MPTYEVPAPQRADDAVVVSFEGPGKRNRLTVAFRIILAIPAFLWLYILGIAAFFAGVIGWIAAIFIGRLPKGFATFLGRFVQYNARFYAYTQFLLTDRYPPFALDAPDGAVNVEFNPGRLNRAAVLFRLILAIPVYVAQSVVSSGVGLASPVVWLIVLVSGRMPASLFEAEAAALRYQTKFWSYFLMLTGEYPGGLFGDGAATAEAEPPAALPATPRVTRLVLSRAARRLVVLFIVLGVLIGGGGIVAGAVTAARTNGAIDKLDTRQVQLLGDLQHYAADTQHCALSGGIDCLHSADVRLADAFTSYRADVERISFPLTLDPYVSDLEKDADNVASILRHLSSINDQQQYQATFADFQKALNQFNADYNALPAQ